jgi:hypothetical protein
LAHPIEIDTEVAERSRHDLCEAQIVGDVVEQTADQKLQREVVDALAALGEGCPVGGEPAVNDPVAQRQRRCDEPIAPGCGGRILADGDGELGEDRGFELFDRLVRRQLIADRGQGARLNRIRPMLWLHRPLPKSSRRIARGRSSRGGWVKTTIVNPRQRLSTGPLSFQGFVSRRCRDRCGTKPRSTTTNLARARVDGRTEKNP